MSEQPAAPQDEQLNDALTLWQLIGIGDRIQLEARLIIADRTQLEADRYYEVVGKSDDHHSFYVESDLTGEVVEVFPGFVADYQSACTPPHHA